MFKVGQRVRCIYTGSIDHIQYFLNGTNPDPEYAKRGHLVLNRTYVISKDYGFYGYVEIDGEEEYDNRRFVAVELPKLTLKMLSGEANV